MEDSLNLFVQQTSWFNDIVLGTLLPESWWTPLPHFLQGWLRNYIGGSLLYLVSGVLWCSYIYYLKRNVYIPKVTWNVVHNLFNFLELAYIGTMWAMTPTYLIKYRRISQLSGTGIYWDNVGFVYFDSPLDTLTSEYFALTGCLNTDAIPSNRAMLLQIGVAMKAMPWYTLLPTVSEYMIENGWTRCFARISDIGWVAYISYLIVYLVFVEFGIYWMHRELHDIKPLYKYLHATHHIYNKQNTLSPFAGLAFHPVDGILQAAPHVMALFLVRVHFLTHIALLFIEAVWTANIHDCIHGKLWPVMGAGYHTIHHTTYRHNYGHYTIWMDWMFGTLRDPAEDEAKRL